MTENLRLKLLLHFPEANEESMVESTKKIVQLRVKEKDMSRSNVLNNQKYICIIKNVAQRSQCLGWIQIASFKTTVKHIIYGAPYWLNSNMAHLRRRYATKIWECTVWQLVLSVSPPCALRLISYGPLDLAFIHMRTFIRSRYQGQGQVITCLCPWYLPMPHTFSYHYNIRNLKNEYWSTVPYKTNINVSRRNTQFHVMYFWWFFICVWAHVIHRSGCCLDIYSQFVVVCH